MVFTVPQCADTDMWGPPTESADPDKALTYAPFTRSDKLGRGAPRVSPSLSLRRSRSPPTLDLSIGLVDLLPSLLVADRSRETSR